MGTALADLAATGAMPTRDSRACCSSSEFPVARPSWDGLRTTTLNEFAAGGGPPPAAVVEAAMARALDRTYAVAWSLRGPVAHRVAQRPALGWIAVSGEDDKPHRPVNVPAPLHEQHEITITLGAVRVATRFIVASDHDTPAAAQAFDPRSVPLDPPLPAIPADSEVVLFLHGHSSGADEALEFIPHLLHAGREKGKDLTVIAFDLPNNGYSETFVGTTVAPRGRHHLPASRHRLRPDRHAGARLHRRVRRRLRERAGPDER